MATISQKEIEAAERYVTDDMVEDALRVCMSHRPIRSLHGIFTPQVGCTCGERCASLAEWKRHLARIIVIRHTAILINEAWREGAAKGVARC